MNSGRQKPSAWSRTPSLFFNSLTLLLGLDRLELRRLRADLVTCYKIINGLLDIPFDTFFRLDDYRCTRGHPLKLFLSDSRINARAYSFPVRVIAL